MEILKDYLDKFKHQPAQEYTPLKLPGQCAADCPVCGGIGWVRYDLPITDPRFGRMEVCPNRMADVLAQESGLECGELDAKWGDVANLNNALEAVRVVQETIERGAGWVTLWGDWGLSKSLILQIAVAESLRSGKPAAYTRMVEILDDLRAAFDGSESSESRLERWTNVPVLAIDEIEKVKETEYANERRFLLLDRRYQDAIRGNSITIISSNRNPRELPGEICSRIFDGRFAVVHLTGDDVRPMMRW